MKPTFPALLALALFAAPVAAEEMVGDPEAGAGLALDICGDCHEVGGAPDVLSTDKPRSFVVIANDPKYTATSLRVFLQTPHVEMPDLILTPTQTDDIVAYILSLKR